MNEDEEEHRDTTPFGMNETSAVLGSITNTLDEKCFAQSLEDRCDVREFAVSMGAMTAWTSDYLFDDDGTSGIGITMRRQRHPNVNIKLLILHMVTLTRTRNIPRKRIPLRSLVIIRPLLHVQLSITLKSCAINLI